LYLAAHLSGYPGRRFRPQYDSHLMDLADDLVKYESVRAVAAKVPFLFLENELGKRSLAYRYWPRFRASLLSKSRSSQPSVGLFNYLIAMEPISTPEMYAAVWKNETDGSMAAESLPTLKNLKVKKRIEVLDALRVVYEERIKTNWKSNAYLQSELVLSNYSSDQCVNKSETDLPLALKE